MLVRQFYARDTFMLYMYNYIIIVCIIIARKCNDSCPSENFQGAKMFSQGIRGHLWSLRLVDDRFQYLSVTGDLESRGITVWVDVVGLQAGVDFLSKIGQAIIDSKVSRLIGLNFGCYGNFIGWLIQTVRLRLLKVSMWQRAANMKILESFNCLLTLFLYSQLAIQINQTELFQKQS